MDSRDIANPERDAGGGTFFLSSLVGCCILVASMALVSLAARTTNRNTAADEASAVRSALQSEINTIAERMRAFAAVTPAGSTTDSASSAARPFWRLFRIAPEAPARFEPSTAADPAQAALKGFLRASPARDDLRGGFAPSPDLLPNVIARADIIRVGNDAAIAVALGRSPGTSWRRSRHRTRRLRADRRGHARPPCTRGRDAAACPGTARRSRSFRRTRPDRRKRGCKAGPDLDA